MADFHLIDSLVQLFNHTPEPQAGILDSIWKMIKDAINTILNFIRRPWKG